MTGTLSLLSLLPCKDGSWFAKKCIIFLSSTTTPVHESFFHFCKANNNVRFMQSVLNVFIFFVYIFILAAPKLFVMKFIEGLIFSKKQLLFCKKA